MQNEKNLHHPDLGQHPASATKWCRAKSLEHFVMPFETGADGECNHGVRHHCKRNDARSKKINALVDASRNRQNLYCREEHQQQKRNRDVYEQLLAVAKTEHQFRTRLSK